MIQIQQVGVGQDKEPLLLEVLPSGKVQIIAVGNERSPFEFENEEEAIAFVSLVAGFRLRERETEGELW